MAINRIKAELQIIFPAEVPVEIIDAIPETVDFNGHPEFLRTILSALEICSKKNADYTGGQASDHPLANFLMAQEFGINPADGLLLRMLDKWQRIKSFKKNGKLQVVGESVEDAFMDIGVYAFLMLTLLKTLKEQDNAKDVHSGTLPGKN